MIKPQSKGFTPKRKPIRRRDDKFYHTNAWRRLRQSQLWDEPLCRMCGKEATDVDHVKPMADGGNPWDKDNLQSLCHSCHSRKTMRELNQKR